MRLTLTARDDKLAVAPEKPLADFNHYVNAWKAAKCKFHGHSKTALLDLDNLPHAAKAFAAAGYKLIPDKSIAGVLEQRVQDLKHARAYSQALIETAGLYPYQAEGVEFLRGRTHALLMDDMGLGKTVQALCAAPPDEPLTIVCPLGVIAVWKQHLKDWRPDMVERTNIYNPDKMKAVRKIPAGTLIVDEAHYYKNFKAFRTRLMRNWAKQSTRVWLLTGTPLMSDPKDLWGVLQICGLGGKAYGSWEKFLQAFGGKAQHFGGYKWAKTPSPAAAEMLQSVALRRTKKQVQKQIPAKTYTTVPVTITSHSHMAVDKALSVSGVPRDFLRGKDAELSARDITLMSHTRRILSAAKKTAALNYIKAHADKHDPMVVFSAHVDVIDAIGMRDGWDVITGQTPQHIRDEIVREFQAGELAGVACTIRAAGTGITLTRSNHTLFIDRSWSPAENDQAEDRTCRIGQDRGCRYVDLVANHPLDRLSHAVNAKKRRYIDGSVEKVLPKNRLLGELEKLLELVNKL